MSKKVEEKGGGMSKKKKVKDNEVKDNEVKDNEVKDSSVIEEGEEIIVDTKMKNKDKKGGKVIKEVVSKKEEVKENSDDNSQNNKFVISKEIAQFLNDAKFIKSYDIDNNESITPTTDKGYLNMEELSKKLLALQSEPELNTNDISNIDNINKILDNPLSEQTNNLVGLQKLLGDNPIFIKKYQYKESETSKVLRFGIDTSNKLSQEEVGLYNNLERVLDKQNNPALSNFSKITTKKENVAVYISYAEKNITQTEKNILENAKNSIVDKQTVLIDLFARHDSDGEYGNDFNKNEGNPYKTGDIKYNKDGSIETHTVVLYKQSGKYLVVDPSNATFSSILAGVSNNIVVCFDKEFQIYKPSDSGNVGPEEKQWRDCIDIAVKLAFYINRYSPTIDIQEKDGLHFMERTSLQKYNFVEDLTNNNAINQSLPGEIKMYMFRAQQSSSVLEEKLSSVWLKVMHSVHKNVIDKISSLKLSLKDPLETMIDKFFTTNFDSHKHSISELKNLISVDMLSSDSSNTNEVIQLIGLAKLECENIKSELEG